jgi:hypothetical protein
MLHPVTSGFQTPLLPLSICGSLHLAFISFLYCRDLSGNIFTMQDFPYFSSTPIKNVANSPVDNDSIFILKQQVRKFFPPSYINSILKKEIKSIPITGHGGLQNYALLRIPHWLDDLLTDHSEVVVLNRNIVRFCTWYYIVIR